MNAPKIYLILGPDGSIEDVSVLTRDHQTRILGFRLIEQLSEELEVFEARIKERIIRLMEEIKKNEH